ncbi:hypothetical protein DIPPA_12813 [Diplonema papillatum]|nr:hypothetical protein DIPPA_12813 [Diplonema papillatum]
MPTAAEEAWVQLVIATHESLTEVDLVLMNLPDLRALMSHHGFTPLQAARAEVQWQVLQSTHVASKRREYEGSVRSGGSPARSLPYMAPSTPGDAPAHAMDAPTPLPAGFIPPSVLKVHQQRRSVSRLTSCSPRRELGSRDGVHSPRSLRHHRTPSPSALSMSAYQYPVVHDREFEVPKVPRGPHLSRRACLSPRLGSRKDDLDAPPSGKSMCYSPRKGASACNPNDLGSRSDQPLPCMKSVGPGMPSAASDPNMTSYDKQNIQPPGVRMVPSAAVDNDVFGPAVTPTRTRDKYLPTERIAATSNPNDTVGTLTQAPQKPIVHHYATDASSCNPNPSKLSRTDTHPVPRKGRSGDKGLQTEEIVPLFLPTPGPPEQGVMPGTRSWYFAPKSEVTQRKAMQPVFISPAGSDPNLVNYTGNRPNVKFIGGGRAQVQPATAVPGDVIFGKEEKERHCSRAVTTVAPAAPVDPNYIAREPLKLRLMRPASPAPAWTGPSENLPSPRQTTGKRSLQPPGPFCSDASQCMFTGSMRRDVSSPRHGARDFTPRFVPS